MVASCKGICSTYKAQSISNSIRYELGQKRCTFCSLYLQVDGIKCPCCGTRLRSKARHRSSKRRQDKVWSSYKCRT